MMNDDTQANKALYGTVSGTVFPLPGDQALFHGAGQERCHVVTRQVLQALEACGHFRSLDDQVAAVTSAIADLRGREQQVRQVLEGLVGQSLLQNAAERLARLEEEGGAEAGGVRDVVIRSTGGAALPRLLASLHDNERRHGNQYVYRVVDDADSEEARAALRRAVDEAASRGLDCRLLDRRWQAEFTAGLIGESGAQGAGWLFEAPDEGGFTGGRAWNVALLAMAGRPFVMLDDDLLCAPRTQPELSTSLALADAGWSLWFHAGPDEAGGSGAPCDFDPIARHGEFLGRGLGGTVARLVDGAAGLEGVDSRALDRLPVSGRVLSTGHGTYGDAASATNLWYYTATGASRERFWASRQDYETFHRSRWVTRIRSGHSLQARPTFTPAGLDGRRLLPPTLPSGRNEDFLFGALLERTHPGARMLSFPWALGHFPDAPRHWARQAHELPITPDLARFAADHLWLAAEAARGPSPETRLGLAADQIQALAAEPDRDLMARVDEYLLYARSDLVQQLQQCMADVGEAPVYWAADMRRIVETNGRALSDDRPPRLAGMPSADEDARGWLRDRLGRLAAGLAAWPALFDAARESGGAGD